MLHLLLYDSLGLRQFNKMIIQKRCVIYAVGGQEGGGNMSKENGQG